jgi:uncharacterized protein with NRDE domain
MCTLVAGFAPGTPTPVWIAANRDELLTRPASGPRHWPGEPFWAPRDEAAGGSWLGLTDGGMFVGVTNRFGAPRDDTRESRGTLVLEALRAKSAKALHAQLATTPAHRFNAFHLLYADATDAFVTWCDGERVQQQTLSPGVHVVTERSLGGDDHRRTEHVRSALAPLTQDGRVPEPAELQALLRIHDPNDPPGSVCVHVAEWNYGTRSSLVLYLPVTQPPRAFWAEGSPCVAPFQEVAPR